jgi:ABC-2 type transport system permease protein
MTRQLRELIRKEILVLLRDKQTILLLFLMPVALIFFMTLALKGVYTDKIYERQIQLVIENESKLPKASLLEQKIGSHKQISRVDRPEGMDDDRIFAENKAQAVVRIPGDLTRGKNRSK